MASTSAISMAVPPAAAVAGRRIGAAAAPLDGCLTLNRTRSGGARAGGRLQIRAAAGGDKAAAGLTAAAIAAALVLPEMAEAAQPGISPSLKNFLLSIASGGSCSG
ncbi:unnamed protein product [Spirodela intermedia]|uniref:Uncharacterized protein n=1 Tax=Spirodela intermedia TaxID=51605 RepID=A0A7I8J2F3_SPIIN|nr:unnamed protein product [Spirodela intermedia]CAA6664239.1 unnamed protein product [Spirodela intermedia]